MEVFDANKIADETLTGGSLISQLDEDANTILRPTLEETVGGDDLGVEVVTTTVVEKTEVSVVEMVQNDKEDEVMKSVEHVEEGVFGKSDGNDDVDEGIDVNRDENGAAVAMDVDGSLEIGLSVEKQNNNENGSKILDEEMVENREDTGEKLAENEQEEHEDHGFIVGDFVWGKIKSHPWWPGQIYDPSDASDHAARLKHKGQILVAHFGDGSFSWCTPSQLKPFIDHFQEMSRQSESKKFVYAVQMAVEEVSRLVEEGLMCKCQTVNRVDHVGVLNRGVKEGVPVPKGNTVKVFLDQIKPAHLLTTLKDSATLDPSAGRAELELTLLKSFLSAFYSQKGGHLLVKYHDPMCIEGLEDKSKGGVVADSDIKGPSESIDNGGDKLHQNRKQKSVAELLKEDEPAKSKKSTIAKNGGSGKRKRKEVVVSVTPESDHESGDGGGGVEDETMSPRQRKKSKYLSPPYYSPVGSGRLSAFGSGPGSGSFKESKLEAKPELEPEKVSEKAVKRVKDSSSKKSSRKKTRQNGGVNKGSESQEEPSAGVNVNKVLHGLLRVALDPTSSNDKNAPAVTDFISSYRSSVFKEGPGHQTDGKKDAGVTDGGLEFIKQKLESMMGIVQGCEETEMRADLKATLEGGIKEVLEKVGSMKGE
ncbi:uncharacterized protein LOC143594759 isoform X2 [Bidens hawaiensis]